MFTRCVHRYKYCLGYMDTNAVCAIMSNEEPVQHAVDIQQQSVNESQGNIGISGGDLEFGRTRSGRNWRQDDKPGLNYLLLI